MPCTYNCWFLNVLLAFRGNYYRNYPQQFFCISLVEVPQALPFLFAVKLEETAGLALKENEGTHTLNLNADICNGTFNRLIQVLFLDKCLTRKKIMNIYIK